MKKTISILLALVTLFSGLSVTASTTVLDKDAVSFQISADENYTTELSTSKEQAVQALNFLLSGAKPVETEFSPTSNAVATISAKQGDDSSTTFQFFAENKNIYISQKDGVTAIADPDAWKEFNKAIGSSFYKFSGIPQVTLAEHQIFANESSYAYQKIDNLYYRPLISQQKETPTFKLKAGASPTLEFSLTPNSVNIKTDSESFDSLDAFYKHAASSSKTQNVVLTANYNSDFYRGEVVYPFVLDYGNAVQTSSKKVSFKVENSNTYPGELAIISAYNVPEGQAIKYSGNLNFEPTFYKESKGEYVALLPLNYRSELGTYTISLSAGGTTEKFKIKLNHKKFQIQHLTADSETTSQTINSKKANEEFEKVIAPLRPVGSKTPYWKENSFVWPTVPARVTTEFGMIRYVNGAPTSSRHGAIDFALPRGTRVNATNNGKVLYAGFLQLTGNTVVIEHGYGLKSWYYHMDSLNVKTDQMVESGQKIGEVGTTGFSTGNHLHFGFSVNNVYVNPTTIIDGELFK